jgi:sec-independent protein translocase protein TatA
MSLLPLFPTVGVPELLIILVIVLIFFGAGKLPQIGKALGEGIRGFRDGARGGGDETEAGNDRDHSAKAKQSRDPHDDSR